VRLCCVCVYTCVYIRAYVHTLTHSHTHIGTWERASRPSSLVISFPWRKKTLRHPRQCQKRPSTVSKET
jgi:hypothetical protein